MGDCRENSRIGDVIMFSFFKKKEKVTPEDSSEDLFTALTRTHRERLTIDMCTDDEISDTPIHVKSLDRSEYEEAMKDQISSYENYFNSDLYCGVIHDEDIKNLLKTNHKVLVSFRFDWESYESWIVVTGVLTGIKLEFITPQIPLIGGVWSNLVATRMITGQVLVSSLLECVKTQIEYVNESNNYDAEIIVVDKCFYAPFMYYTRNTYGKLCNGNGNESDTFKDYSYILTKGYPKSYKAVLALKSGESYWKTFHDTITEEDYR